MTFTEIIYFMLSMVKASTQNALERFFPQVGKERTRMSQQAFSAARKKIKWEAFKELFESSVSGCYHEDWKRWRGYRLMAIDGSFVQLPADAELLAHYGGLGYNQSAATALGSLLYDLENDIIVDAKLEKVSGNERELAKEHIQVLMGLESYEAGHELIIFDWGYPSKGLVTWLEERGIAYVMRVAKGFIREGELAGKRERWTVLGKRGPEVRALRIVLSSGEEETLITNRGEGEIEYEALFELYNLRWGIETKYLTVKEKLELENFSGLLVDNIKQDFYAMMTVANMISSCVRQAKEGVQREREGRENKYEYQVNVNHAIGVFKDRLIGVVIQENPWKRVWLMKEMIREIERRVVPIRPNREVKRNKYPRKARFHHNQKSNC